MTFPKKYNCLNTNHFQKDDFSIVPIRYEDRLNIMQWRNEQIYHLRQKEPLTKKTQDEYFKNVVAQLFEQKQPNQLLFSFLKEDKCIGYGGLVHINWVDKNAEISFIMETASEKEYFSEYWLKYLSLIEQVTFQELNLHKIYTYAFDLRPHLYKAVEKAGFQKEAVLKEHCFFDGEFKDVVIHSKINNQLSLRKAFLSDVEITFEWANDKITRKQSFNSENITYDEHRKWWNSKIETQSKYYICEVNNTPVGIVRFDQQDDSYVIGINIAPDARGNGFASRFLKLACKEFRQKFDLEIPIYAFIKPKNTASIKAFEKANFRFVDNSEINQKNAVKYKLSDEK